MILFALLPSDTNVYRVLFESESKDIIDIIKEYRNVFSSIQNSSVEKHDIILSYNITDSDSSEENDLSFKSIETIFPSSSNFFTSES